MYKLADGTNSTDYKIGDRFEVVSKQPSGFTTGSLVEFYRDDKSKQPLFKLISGNCGYSHVDGEKGAYEFWEGLKPYTTRNCVDQAIQSNINEAITTLQSLIAWPEITLEVSDDTVLICVWGRKFSTAGEDVEAVLETVNMLVGQEIPQ